MVVFPNAKINLGLYITARRPDGYHEIETVMIPVDWHDILEIVPTKGTSATFTVTGRRVDCPPEKNLVMKAYRALDTVVPLPPLDIYLHKIVPDGAGLGGGSADAAFTLTAINSMLDLQLGADCLKEIAAKLGADCPMFIDNSPVLATGIGTTLSPITLPSLTGLTVVIAKPCEGVSTALAYAAITPRPHEVPITDIISRPVKSWRDTLVNDFEPGISAIHPEISRLRNLFYDCGALYSAMSGSGSAVYGLFDNAKMADTAYRKAGTTDIHIGTL